MKGFELIMKLLNTTDDIDLKKESAMVLGAAIQSNPKVKIHAIKSEFLQLILNKLAIKSVPNQEAASLSSKSPTSILENDDFHSKLLFTLSGLLREYPFAQNQFIRFGGINILSNLIETTSSFKVKLKIITLTNDLIQEKVFK
jgi:nucleotide exchange factor SIL1